MAGLFLALDGLDGCGKSTQARHLCAWLRSLGHEVVACSDPGGTAIGNGIRDMLLHQTADIALTCEALLFMAGRAQLVSEVVRPALDAGRIVVSDRFLLANVVYQGHAGGLNVDDLWRVGLFATAGLEPDKTLVLDLPAEAARDRLVGGADRIESRSAEYHERVRAGFLAEARRRPDRIEIIDARPSLEEVFAVIQHHVQRLLS